MTCRILQNVKLFAVRFVGGEEGMMNRKELNEVYKKLDFEMNIIVAGCRDLLWAITKSLMI